MGDAFEKPATPEVCIVFTAITRTLPNRQHLRSRTLLSIEEERRTFYLVACVQYRKLR